MELRCTKIATTDRDIKLCDEVRYKVEKATLKQTKSLTWEFTMNLI